MNVLLVLVLAVFTSPVTVQADTVEATAIVTVSGSAGILA